MITGVILAGGAGRRMGGHDKGLLPLRGRPLAAWVRDTLAPQVDHVLAIANRNVDAYRAIFGAAEQDLRPDYPGPLAGIESALHFASTEWIITSPVDTPHLPPDYVARMRSASAGRPAVATLAGRPQPVFALVPRSALPSLQTFLDRGDRKVMLWLAELDPVKVAFDDAAELFRDADTLEALADLG